MTGSKPGALAEIRFPAIVVAIGIFAGACATTRDPGSEQPTVNPCDLLPRAEQSPAQVTVALLEDLESEHAPYPRNPSERLVFAHLYETLVRLDCTGELQPGLADSWRSEDSREWVFSLRHDAAFWDGSPVNAVDVAVSWERTAEKAGLDLLPYSIRAQSQRDLAVTVASPRLLADPIFAVAGPEPPGGGWPQGTGPYRIEAAPDLRQASGAAGFEAVPVGLDGGVAGPERLQFRFSRGADLRDLLDQEVDLLLTGDRSVLEYAAVRSRAVPLPWHRTLVLLLPARSRSTEIASGAEEPGALASFRQRLARDAVRGEARGAEGPFWWQGKKECQLARSSASETRPERRGSGSPTGRLVYADGDPESRDLAERLVALANFPSPPSGQEEEVKSLLRQLARQTSGGLRAAGLASEELAEALKLGDESAYVLSLPKRVLDPCREIRALLDRAQWLADRPADEHGHQGSMAATVLEHALLPLVDLRLRTVVGPELSPLRIDWAGTPLVFDPEEQER